MKIGILGCGMIVHTALRIIADMDEVSCTAIWSRAEDQKMKEELVKAYAIPACYTDIQDFLSDPSFDVVYVGLINSVHYEYTRLALEAGKHVICEKPFTSTYEQARKLVCLAKERKLFLFEAIMLRYLDNYAALKAALPQLGDIKLIQCNYSQLSSRYPSYLKGVVLPAFEPALSGGSLYDINVYCIQFVMGLFGKPKDLMYYANLGYNGIDTSGLLVLDYDAFKAVCVGAKDSDSPAGCTIQGTNGYIHMNSMPGMVQQVMLCLKGCEEQCLDVLEVVPMQNEFMKIKEMIDRDDRSQADGYMETTLEVMDVLERARKGAGILFPADDEVTA